VRVLFKFAYIKKASKKTTNKQKWINRDG